MAERMYRTINPELYNKLDIKLEKNYSYSVSEKGNSKTYELIESNLDEFSKGKRVELEETDLGYEWDKEKDEVLLKLKVIIKNLNKLFGESGVALNDATLGIGIEWKAANSKIRNCIKLGEFNNIDCKKEFYNEIKLSNFESNIIFNLIIYIANPSILKSSNGYANDEGIILGTYNLWTIINEGKGSMFPILNFSEKNGPLWKIYCNYVDIMDDLFEDNNVKIMINKSHPLYSFYQVNNKNYNPRLMANLLANALTLLIIDIKEKNDNHAFDLEEDGEIGSIQQAIKYYHDILGFNVNGTNSELSESIQKFFDKEFK